MKKINFENLPSTKTPINAENLNQMQSNVEEAINENYELINNLSKTYKSTNITAPTVAGYGRIKKLSNKKIDDINLFEETQNNKSMNSAYARLILGKFSIIQGEEYTISLDTNNNGGQVYINEEYFDHPTNAMLDCDGKRKTYTAIAKTTATYEAGTLVKTSKATTTNYNITNVKLQKGSVATSYSPYNYATVEVISKNGENKSSNICYVKNGLNEEDYIDYKLGKVVRKNGTIEDALNCSDKIVQYADSTNIYNRDGAEIELSLTNNKTVSELNEQDKLLEEKINDRNYKILNGETTIGADGITIQLSKNPIEQKYRYLCVQVYNTFDRDFIVMIPFYEFETTRHYSVVSATNSNALDILRVSAVFTKDTPRIELYYDKYNSGLSLRNIVGIY